MAFNPQNPNGQAVSANSEPVVIASDQSAIPISSATLATAAKQDTGNTSVASVDTKTPALGQALAAASTPVVLTAAQVTTLTPQVNALTDTQLRASAVPVSLTSTTVTGTVTANVGTTNGLALDATLTGGTAKSILRTAAKGTTVAADTTSTPVDANTQALDVSVKGTVPVSGTFFQATQPVSIAGTVTTTGGLTDTQLRATAVPVSLASTTVTGSVAVTGPLTDTQLRATAVPVSGTVAVTGVATETTLAALNTKVAAAKTFDLDSGVGTDTVQALGIAVAASGGSVAITGDAANGLDVDVTRLPALVAGSAVIGALTANQSVNAAQINGITPLMGNGITGTGSQRVTIASDNTAFPVNATLGAETTKVIGTVNIAAAQTVATVTAVTAITNALPTGANVIGALTANQSVNNAQVNGVAISTGSGVTGTGVQRVVLATDVILPAIAEIRAATLHVTATAAANTAITATLPAVAGQFHYITAIHLMRNATAALGGTATLIHTSANLPGSPAWSVGNAMTAGGTQLDLNYTPTTPLKSSVVNTATTITMPAPGAAVLNRINISYFTAA